MMIGTLFQILTMWFGASLLVAAGFCRVMSRQGVRARDYRDGA